MFSCLGPDSLRELRAVYAAMGWPAPGHAFTDMHDWGDMLIEAGFAEPVMDMERITLTFPTAQRLLQELQELGANLHPQRFAGLRGRHWHARLLKALEEHLQRPGLQACAPGAGGRAQRSVSARYACHAAQAIVIGRGCRGLSMTCRKLVRPTLVIRNNH